MFLVVSGQLQCSKLFPGNEEETKLKVFEPGDAFGELALLYNAPRAASIRAISDCILFSLDRDTFNHIVKGASRKKIEKYEQFIQTVSILKGLDPYEIQKLCEAFKPHEFSMGEKCIKQGDEGNSLYFVEEGELYAEIEDEKGEKHNVKEYSKGDYFGERALLKSEPRAATIIVKTLHAKLVSLDRKTFKRLLGPLEDILQRNMAEYENV